MNGIATWIFLGVAAGLAFAALVCYAFEFAYPWRERPTRFSGAALLLLAFALVADGIVMVLA